MKSNKIYKNTLKFIMIIAIIIASVIAVSAATNVPNSLKISYSQYGTTPVDVLENFHIKYLTNDKSKYVYCLTYTKTTPNDVSYTLGKEITDPGINYILAEGANNKTKSEYFITQSALWIYMQDKGLKTYSNSINYLSNNVSKSSVAEAKAIKNLVAEAKKKTSVDSSLTLSADSKALTFTLSSDKKNYVSNVVKVTSNSSYTVTVTGTGAKKEDVTGGFRIVVPVSSVSSLSNSISATINTSKTIYHSYEYNPSNSKYQVMSYTVPETLSKKITLTGTIDKTQVTISKVDVTTGEELPGATLNLNCNEGAYNKTWVSTTEPKVLTDVPEGTCSLTETIAPDGYIKSEETITFKVVAGKATSKQVMKNTPLNTVTISKVDVTNGKELPGATLNLNCNKGAYTKTWVSTTEPKVLTDVPEGTCSLTETIAPEGYIKSEETITFKVVAGKATSKQVMKNTPLNTVTISKVDVTNGEELPGATLNLNCNEGAYNKTWVSTTEPKVLTDVPEGTCSLTETIAPEGYIKSEETITFKVVAGKATSKQVMKNAPEVKTFEVEISKLDITTSKEIAGAKLEIINKQGTVVCEWTSDGEIHTCKNLIAGTYTLTEITAPDGYEKAESITFVIDEDGNISQDGENVDKIIMYDEPTPTIIPNVPNTLSFKSTITYAVGFAIILSGIGIVVKICKKNEQ